MWAYRFFAFCLGLACFLNVLIYIKHSVERPSVVTRNNGEGKYQYKPTSSMKATSRNRLKYRYAYATLMCNDQYLLPTLSMLGSLLQSAPAAGSDIVIIITQLVSEASASLLEKMHHSIRLRWIAQNSKSSGFETSRSQCVYSKLHAWNLTEYTRIILLDSDGLVLHSLDHLFKLPVFAEKHHIYAVADVYPQIFNSGFIVLQPSTSLFDLLIKSARSMRSYNNGDQGFLNEFFGSASGTPNLVGTKWTPLDVSYNFPTWLANSYYGKSKYPRYPRGVSFLHFAGESKPWRLDAESLQAWQRFYEPRGYLKWRIQANNIISSLCQKFSETPICKNFQKTAINVSSYSCQMCIENADRYAVKEFEKTRTKTTVLISTFRGERLSINALIHHYGASPNVAHIVIIWHDPDSIPTQSLYEIRALENGVGVTIVHPGENSLNNRFLPVDLRTASVVICDDDILVSLDDFEFAFSIAAEHDDRIVSPFVRTHLPRGASGKDEDPRGYYEHDLSFSTIGRRGYSMALTKFCFAPGWLLFVFSCLLDPRVYTYVDNKRNCEDVAFNIMASSVGLKAPLMVDITVRDFGSRSGLSSRREHYLDRYKCVPDLSALISPLKKKKTLKVASAAVSRFISTRVKYEKISKSLQTTHEFDSSARLYLQRDVATVFYPCEDTSIDVRAPAHEEARRMATSKTLIFRSTTSGAISAPYNFNLGQASASLEQKMQNRLFANAISLIKVRRHDLYLVDRKDEQRGVILLDFVVKQASANLRHCPLAFYYLPQLSESWVPEMITFEFLQKSIELSGQSSYFVPIFSVGSMLLIDLNMIDTAFRKKRGQSASPHNVTFAIFLNSNSTNASCEFDSSRGPFPPYFELVKYRRGPPTSN